MNNNSIDNLFDDSNVNLDALKQKAYNGRWAEVDEGVIPLTAADPDFPVAKEITQSIIDYLQDGYLSYTPHSGLQSFKESVADYLNTYKNENVDPSLVLPIDSAARGMYIIAESVLEKGDEVISVRSGRLPVQRIFSGCRCLDNIIPRACGK